MGFEQNNVRRVREDFRMRRHAAAEEAERRKQELYAKMPEIELLDREIASVGVRVMGEAIAGGDVEAKIEAMRQRHSALRARRAAILTAAGYAADYSDIHYRCETCLDTGFAGTRMCDCMRRELVLLGYETSGIGALLQTQSFANFSLDYYDGQNRAQMAANLTALREFASNFPTRRGESFLLLGPTGLGKTHLSTSVARTVLDLGYHVVYDTAQQCIAAASAAQFEHREDAAEAMERYLTCDLLILDDLGTEMTNSFTVSCLYNIINTRINARRSTLLNTNLTQSELRTRYADRITSRLFGEFRPLLFAGRDIRAQKLMR